MGTHTHTHTHTHTQTVTIHTNKYILIFTIVPFTSIFLILSELNKIGKHHGQQHLKEYGNKKTVPCVSIAHTLLFTIIIDIVSRRM